MRMEINQEVSVVMYYSARGRRFVPCRVNWQSKDYNLGPVDYYHSYMDGRERQHIFELCDKECTLWFRLRLNGLNLHWTLDAVHDGSS